MELSDAFQGIVFQDQYNNSVQLDHNGIVLSSYADVIQAAPGKVEIFGEESAELLGGNARVYAHEELKVQGKSVMIN